MKRSPALLELSREHHTALSLAARIARAADPAAEADLMARVQIVFRDELAPHFVAEEEGLLPAMAAAGERALVERTLGEHRLMQQMVDRIAAGDRDSLKAFGQQLTAHVRFEERELFMAAQVVLPAAYLDRPR